MTQTPAVAALRKSRRVYFTAFKLPIPFTFGSHKFNTNHSATPKLVINRHCHASS